MNPNANTPLRPHDTHVPEATFRQHGFTEADLRGITHDSAGRAYVPVLRFRPLYARRVK